MLTNSELVHNRDRKRNNTQRIYINKQAALIAKLEKKVAELEDLLETLKAADPKEDICLWCGAINPTHFDDCIPPPASAAGKCQWCDAVANHKDDCQRHVGHKSYPSLPGEVEPVGEVRAHEIYKALGTQAKLPIVLIEGGYYIELSEKRYRELVSDE